MLPKIQPIDINFSSSSSEACSGRCWEVGPEVEAQEGVRPALPKCPEDFVIGEGDPGAKLLLSTARMEESAVERLSSSPAQSLAKMVQNFIEESNEKRSVEKTGRNWCNCFDGNDDGSSGDKFDIWNMNDCAPAGF
ncbi:hypothetical protein NL676_021033 [Syzygium grande]|nr:hypothetical protein NL676_021033 [Syzygium grande]